ncbi:glycosyltransferase [Cryobacterium sp. TMT1-21]|uniref:D-inositol 3-phosphate glycosyltransferase n=2 Tax=Microbacteriaceae TaxID=85023 RepID=A0AAQ2C8D5_9MICO|nr:glycosyltransferase [Cryobacterium shii]TFD15743.1 glycosyltransferase [Cryobacterium sp. TMT1-21]TFD19438.1 glycosyltransferase [Cryobacterium sp. TMT4-10]TFD26726.1 glycosyltransferase [Cryobacterium sp. TMT2-23]TFD37374.1 glycosyltransferase [Cryobacterium sp. TMT2-10]
MGTHTTLDTMRQSRSILDGIRCADNLTIAASRDGGVRAVRLLAQAALDAGDQLTAIAAIHSLGQVFDESADEVLVSLLLHDSPFIREHAAWAFGARLPRFDALAGLLTMVVSGGFSGMIAQRTLEQWSSSVPEHVALALEGALIGVHEPAARARLVETMGLTAGRIAERLLRRVAVDRAESVPVRATAIAALGDLGPNEASIRIVSELSQGSDELADVARLALVDLTVPTYPRPPWSQGLTVAQLFLHADIDRELSQVGSGDNGGIATLLVRLGDALVAGPAGSPVERVLTLSRGDHAAGLSCLSEVGSTLAGHAFATVPFLGDPVASVDAWPRRIETQRGIRRILRAAGSVDAIHLRMADIGTLAASTVARELDIPIVFTVAPDPHSVIHSLDTSGVLTRANFGTVDETEHFWFRARLVQRLAADAAHTVLFPRPDLQRDMRDLVGIDISQHPERHSVIAEGIDLAVIERSLADAAGAAGAAVAAADVAGAASVSDGAPAVAELDALLATLPTSRQGLPLAVTVGRLHRVKGMATLVEAWAADAGLRASCNLLVLGGDLNAPSFDEQGQLDSMAAVVPLADAAGHGLLLAGHRTNDTVARWLAAARYGRPGLAAPGGVYVCASMKEEFGIALLEAMASGLTVVAPNSGGPATYVEEGVTGYLVDTGNRAALSAGITAALVLASGPFGPEYADRAGAMVAGSFTIQAMAATLSRVYRDVSDASDADEPTDWALSAS